MKQVLKSGDIVRHPESDRVGVLIEKNIGNPTFWKVLTSSEVVVWFDSNIEKIGAEKRNGKRE